MKVLVTGWFSFEGCHVTAGDLMARDVACEWIQMSGIDYDIALAPPFSSQVDWKVLDPESYDQIVFVCGPFPLDNYTWEFLERFKTCRLIGLDLSMFEPVDTWNPFDVLIERDGSRAIRPDIAFASHLPKVPVVGVILVHPQVEYGSRSKHHIANQAIRNLIASREMVAVPIDTCLDPNTTNLRNSAEIETLIARMDLVITTRLHGTVLSIKNGVPVIAIDAISGGAKVTNQATILGWDQIFPVDNITVEKLEQAFDYCLTQEAKDKVKVCREKAIELVDETKSEFIYSLNNPDISSQRKLSGDSLLKTREIMNRRSLLKRKIELNIYEFKGSIRQYFFKKLFRPRDLDWIATTTSITNNNSED